MIEVQTLITFLIATFILVVTPGPNMVYIITRSISQGRKEGIVSALGVDSGSVVHIGFSLIGLSAILATSTIAFQMVKYLGAAYLIYLGVRVIRSGNYLENNAKPCGSNLKQIYFQGVVTNVLNPKAAIFFISFFPQFIDVTQQYATKQIIILGALFILVGVSVDVLVAISAGTLGKWLKTNTSFWKCQRWFCGITFVTLGFFAAFGSNSK